MPRTSLGEFEQFVLLALLQLGGKGHSAPVVIQIEERVQRDVAPAAVYIALRRMEERGLVVSEKQEPGPHEGGSGRRIFEVTPVALTKLREARASLESLWDGLDPLFKKS